MHGFQFGWLIGLFGSSNCCPATSALTWFSSCFLLLKTHIIALSLLSLPVSLSTHLFCNAFVVSRSMRILYLCTRTKFAAVPYTVRFFSSARTLRHRE